jgi:hypothetical protein
MSASQARGLLLSGMGLLQDPARRASPGTVLSTIEQLGFVQVDTINRVERAHEHILHTRLDEYRPERLKRLAERDRKLFEHWTHDAAVIRADWFPFWRHRFDNYRKSARLERWVRKKMGPDHERVVGRVWRRINREGPLSSREFEDPQRPGSGGWWDWKPSRAALEMLWRVGKLSVCERRGFQKVYDRTDRVFPELVKQRKPSPTAHRDWACRAALERLGVATPTELAHQFDAINGSAAAVWAKSALRRGEIVEVEVAAQDGSAARTGFAFSDWEQRVARAPEPPDRMRVLNPFDPLIHDRKRTQLRFDFNYTIECFVPEKKRRYGYYVLPLLDGDRFVGRLDPKFDRDRGVLEIANVWWEADRGPTRAQQRRLEAALDQFTRQLGADRFEIA